MTLVREVKIKYGESVMVKQAVCSSEDVAQLFRSILDSDIELQEHFLVFHLDGANQVTGYRVAHIGTLNMCVVHPREVFQTAIVDNACSIIVAHNHPSGSLKPSNQDRDLTKKLKEAGQILGIGLLDHLIVTEDAHFSFQESGFLF